MSDIAVINHSDCKIVYAWVTQRSVVAMFSEILPSTITKPRLDNKVIDMIAHS